MKPLTRLRIDAGMTAKELSTATGVSRTTISDLERGRGAGPEKLKVLADFLTAKLERPVLASELLDSSEALA